MAKFSATEKKYIIGCIRETMEAKYEHLRETFSDPDGYFKKSVYHGLVIQMHIIKLYMML